MTRTLAILFAAGALWWVSPTASASDAAGDAFFESQVRPVLAKNCLGCHGGAAGKKLKGNLSLRSRADLLKGGDTGPAAAPGDAAHSLLVRAVHYSDPDLKMPPDGRLADAQVAVLDKWVAIGLPWPQGAVVTADSNRSGEDRKDFWSLKPVVRPALPEVHDSAWVRNPIDRFILARLESDHLHPSPEADRRTLLRRVSYDLIGLAPMPEELDAFEADRSPDAYERRVDALLASPRYGERWGRHWLDVVRFAESNGFEMNNPRPNAWPYRDYVIHAFNQDEPYDQFVREQLAGDQLGVPEATGYLVAGPWDEVKSPDPVLTAQQRADELHDMAATTGSTFLGLTVGCARCHDHKFDPISQAEYYQLTAVFSGVQHGDHALPASRDPEAERELAAIDAKLDAAAPLAGVGDHVVSGHRPAVRADRNVDRFAPVDARYVRFSIAASSDGAAPGLDELELWTSEATPRNVALASRGARAAVSGTIAGYAIHRPEHLIDGQYGNDHSWISDRPGSGWVTVELPCVERIDRVVWGRDRYRRFPDRVPRVYRIEVATAAGAWKLVASSEDRAAAGPGAGSSETEPPLEGRREAMLRRVIAAATPRKVYAGNFVMPPATHRLQRGDPMQPREEVAPAGVEAVPPTFVLPASAPDAERRLALARWLTDTANPLTARVMVNRLWHYHFGQGIVSTPGDFGHMGARPTHPELLDWLASELMSDGWRLKALHRQIVLSATYRQSSAANDASLAADADSTLLWRYPPRRLEAEAIRDTILQISGKLDLTAGGPGFEVFQPNANYVHVYAPKETFGPAEWRRMVYQDHPRLQPEPTFGVFDCPDGGQVASKRTVSTTPLQALNLLNSRFVLQQAGFFAQRLRREAGDQPDAQVTRAFRLAFGRVPNESERAAAVVFVRGQGVELFCRVMLNADEVMYVY